MLNIKYPWDNNPLVDELLILMAAYKRHGKGDTGGKGGQFAPKGTDGVDDKLAGVVLAHRKASAARVKASKLQKRFDNDPQNESLGIKLKVARANESKLKEIARMSKKNLPPDKNVLASGKIVEAKRGLLSPASLNKQVSKDTGMSIDDTHKIKQLRKPELRDKGKYLVTDKNGEVEVEIEFELTDHLGIPLPKPGFVVKYGSQKSYPVQELADAVAMASKRIKSEEEAIDRWRNLPGIQRKPNLDSISLRDLEKHSAQTRDKMANQHNGYEKIRNQDILDHVNSVIAKRKQSGVKSVATMDVKGTSDADLRSPNIRGIDTGFNNKAERESIGKITNGTVEVRKGVTEAQVTRYKRRALAVESAKNKIINGKSAKDRIDELLKEGYVVPDGNIDGRGAVILRKAKPGGGWVYAPKGKEVADYLKVALNTGDMKRTYSSLATTVPPNIVSMITPKFDTIKAKTFDNESEHNRILTRTSASSSVPKEGVKREQIVRYNARRNAVSVAQKTKSRDGVLISDAVEKEIENGFIVPVGKITERQAKLKTKDGKASVVVRGKEAVDYLKVLLNIDDKKLNY